MIAQYDALGKRFACSINVLYIMYRYKNKDVNVNAT